MFERDTFREGLTRKLEGRIRMGIAKGWMESSTMCICATETYEKMSEF